MFFTADLHAHIFLQYFWNSNVITNTARLPKLLIVYERAQFGAVCSSEILDLEQTISTLQTEKRSLASQLQDRKDESDDLRVQNDKLQEKLRIRDQEVTM